MIGDMEALLALVAIFTPWMMLAVFAQTLGVDSRDTLPDDHKR